LTIPDPSSLATIYAVRIFLEQTTHVTSPRDGESATPISRLRPFEVLSLGKAPNPQQRLSADVPAIWRGEDKDFCDIEGYARLPDDEFGRPSTPEGYVLQVDSTDEQDQDTSARRSLACDGSLVLCQRGG
jgi:hypothetical protein